MVAGQEHILLGRAGEETAARHLSRLGWIVLERNWRPCGPSRRLELDIVARDGDTLVFVEIKTRAIRPDAGARPALTVPAYTALTTQKQTRLVRAASRYLTTSKNWHRPCRFDLICITHGTDGVPTLEHYTDVIEFGHLVDCGHTAWQPW